MMSRNKISRFVESKNAQTFVTALIIFNAVTLGLETSPSIMAQWGEVLRRFDQLVLVIFVLEITLKIIGRGLLSFFRSGWNIFDFIIIAIALIPASGPLAVLRALRVLRVLRLMSVVPQMRKVIQALITAIPGMLSIIGLISLIFYVSAVLATNFFGHDFDEWFGTIGASMYSLFQIMTLESWSMGIVRPVMSKFPYAWAFFVPFIMITSFAVINLFIGVIVDSMQTQNSSSPEEISPKGTLDISALNQEISSLKIQIARLTEAVQTNALNKINH